MIMIIIDSTRILISTKFQKRQQLQQPTFNSGGIRNVGIPHIVFSFLRYSVVFIPGSPCYLMLTPTVYFYYKAIRCFRSISEMRGTHLRLLFHLFKFISCRHLCLSFTPAQTSAKIYRSSVFPTD